MAEQPSDLIDPPVALTGGTGMGPATPRASARHSAASVIGDSDEPTRQ